MFPRLPPARLPEKCLNSEKDLSDYSSYRCEDMTELDELVGLPCHRDQSKSRLGIDRWLGDYKIGSLAFSGSSLINGGEDFDWIVIRDRVYNVTKYIGGFRDEDSGKIAKDSSETESAYLAGSLHSLIVNKLNEVNPEYLIVAIIVRCPYQCLVVGNNSFATLYFRFVFSWIHLASIFFLLYCYPGCNRRV